MDQRPRKNSYPVQRSGNEIMLERDIANLCQWARHHGLVCDPGEVCAEVMAVVF